MDVIKLNKKAWDKIGSKAVSSYIMRGKFLKIFNLFCQKMPKKAAILDLGCGPGLPITKELVDRGFNVTAVDISKTMIKLAKKNVPQAKHIQASITDINFKEQFDGIISSYSMLCLDPNNFRKTTKKISESLKKGGYFLLSLNEPSSEHKEEENYTNVLGQDIYSRPYAEKEIRDIFTKYNMKILKTGREIITSEQYGKEHNLLILMQKI